MLLLLGVWRYLWRHFPLRYDTSYWGVVFPLGMYAVCTQQMGRVLGIDLLDAVPRVFLVAALLAWALTFVGLLHGIAMGHRTRRRTDQV